MVQTKNNPPKNKPHQPTYQPSPYSMSPFYPYPYLSHPYGPPHLETHSPFSIKNVSFPYNPASSPVNASSSSPQSQLNKPGCNTLHHISHARVIELYLEVAMILWKFITREKYNMWPSQHHILLLNKGLQF